MICLSLQKAYNREFQSTVARKTRDIDKIDELNSRLKDVVHDLEKLGGSTDGVSPFIPTTEDLEDPESVLEVKDEEIQVEKYLSPEEQAIVDVLV